jgi:hypothetical protein
VHRSDTVTAGSARVGSIECVDDPSNLADRLSSQLSRGVLASDYQLKSCVVDGQILPTANI